MDKRKKFILKCEEMGLGGYLNLVQSRMTGKVASNYELYAEISKGLCEICEEATEIAMEALHSESESPDSNPI